MSVLWQFMVSTAFRRGHFDGLVSIDELKKLGGYGIGELAALGGEVIAVGGDFYVAFADGRLERAKDHELLCFAQIAALDASVKFAAPAGLSMSDLAEALKLRQATRNHFYLIVIEGEFDAVTATAYPLQRKPYLPIGQLNDRLAHFSFHSMEGTLVGFFSPSFVKDLGVPGYHMHFVNKLRTGGGHVTSFKLRSGQMSLQPLDRLSLALPSDQAFLDANMEL